MKDLTNNPLNTNTYIYNKPSKFPITKKDFFEAALSRNKPDLDEPLISDKSNQEEETETKINVLDKVK